MSSLVLLNRDGLIERKLQLVSLPGDYVVPEGMIVSWKTELHVVPSDPLVRFLGPREPGEAFFYLGTAQGQVHRRDLFEHKRNGELGKLVGSQHLTITVQGTSAKEVMKLRDTIMQIIHSGETWDVSNDLNPKPKRGFWQRLMGK